MNRSTFSGVLALVLAMPGMALAQEEPATQSPVYDAWQQFLKDHKGPWTSEWNHAAGTPKAIYGEGIRVVDGEVENLDQARAIATTQLTRFAKLLGTGVSTFGEVIGEKANRVYVFVYDQSFKGLPVIDGRADVRLHDNGVLSMIGAEALQIPANFSTTAKLTQKIAWAMAHRLVSQADLLKAKPAPDKGDARLVIWSNLNRKAPAIPTLAWQIQIDNKAQAGDPFAGKVYVNANSGDFLEFRNEVYTCSLGCKHIARKGANDKPPHSELLAMGAELRKPRAKPARAMVNLVGTVKAWTNTNYTSSRTLTNTPMRNMRITVAGSSGVFYTDANGNFNIPWSGTTAVNVTARFRGRHISSITPSIGTTGALTQSVTPGTSATFQFYASNTADTNYSQSTTYWATDDIMTWVRTLLPASGNLNTLSGIRARVNYNGTCNAFYGGNQMTFYRAAGSCRNTAIGTVIYHEWGHGFDDRFGGISQTDGLSEGWGDIVGLYRSGQPILGAGFRTNGGGIRDGRNTRRYPTNGSWGNLGVHARGEVWMGFAWDFRNNMIVTHGASKGPGLAEKAVIPSIVADATNQPNAVREVFIVDDNDGNLNNGTPNYLDLEKAAKKRNLPYPVRKLASITHTALQSTTEQLVPQLAKAQLSVFTGTVSKVELVYKIGNGATARLPMVKSGADYVALLPGAPSPSTIAYHIEAQHSSNTTLREPANGEISYSIGGETVIFSDNFDGSTDNGWTHAQVRTQDDWQRGAPAGKSGTSSNVAWRDPNKAFSGSNCWCNDRGATGWNGSYQPNAENYLRTPALNLTGKTGVKIQFQRWLSVEGSQFDQATVNVNGSNVWKNASGNTTETAWSKQEIDISSVADNKSGVQIEFRLKSDPGLHLGGWAIDDFKVFTFTKLPSLPLEFRMNPAQVGLGKSTTASLKGKANAAIAIGWSTNGASTKIPGLPRLALGTPINVVTISKLDGSGDWSTTAKVPNVAALTGLLIYLQGIQDNAGKLEVSNQTRILVGQ